MAARTYGNLANVYTTIFFQDMDKTMILVHFVDGGVRYKHITHVLGPGKTRLTLTDLTCGKYEVDAIHFSKRWWQKKAGTSFEILPPEGCGKGRSEGL